jgi:phosphoglycerate dehydrogenase-like enzyme
VHTERGADQEAELIRRIGHAEVVINIRAHAKFTDHVLAACPRLRLISIWGTGTDNVDLTACRTRGVAVTNTPGVNAHAVAEHTVGLMLAITRRIPSMDRETRAAQWPRAQLVQIEGKTVGLIGLGAIGGRVAQLLAPFGVHLLATTYGPDGGRAAKAGARHVPVETLLRESDIVSLHLRLSADTQSYLGRDRLALMKPTAFLINTARGAVVDEKALYEALRDKKIAGAGLDVFEEEPPAPDNPLLKLDNVVLTAHTAGVDLQSRDDMARKAAECIAAISRGEWPADSVVNPEVRERFRWAG